MYRVVLADDEPLLLEELKLTLPWKTQGFEVCATAYDGKAAKKAVIDYKADLLITDIRMPEIDGLSLISQLSQLISCKYIVMSGFNDFEYAVQAMRLGVVDFLLKPIDNKVVLTLLTKIKNQLSAAPNEERVKDTYKNAHIRKAIEYMEENYSKNLTIKDVALALYISESYLSKLFAKFAGVGFNSYLNSIRIAKAIELLRSESFKVNEIAEAVGYNDYRYFDIVFKKQTGTTPLKFRNNLHCSLECRN